LECFVCVFACIIASSRITRSRSWKTDSSFLRWFCHNEASGSSLWRPIIGEAEEGFGAVVLDYGGGAPVLSGEL
jgi:hypothetical protein